MEHSTRLAHISEDGTRTQTVYDHLAGTARLAGSFAAPFGAQSEAEFAAWLHDVGKYSDAFQLRLKGGPKVDHSTAGAQEALRRGHPQASFAIAGHHSGLPDGGSPADDPGDYLAPCVSAIAQLIQHYHSTAVLCTATQPALEPLFRRFAPELHPQEITPDAARLYEVLRRTTLQDLGTLPQEEFAARLARLPQALCVVNRRKTAQQLYESLPAEGSYCLTTLLCAADRRRQLDDIRQRLKEGLPCRVVSTSLIEAGVDVDFPVAYREQCGLDSLLQTAGRCNREGRRGAEESIVYRFRLDECSTPQMLKQNVSALDYTARHQDTLDTPRAIQLYFKELSELRGPDAVDKHGILGAFLRGIRGCQFPFAQVAEEFRLIENAARTVYLPVGEGAALCEQLRSGHVTRTLLRKLGVYSVSCYKDQFDKLDAAGALELRPDGSAILTDTSCYSEKTGLAMDVETGIGLYF